MSESLVQRLRLAISKLPNGVGVPIPLHSGMETDPLCRALCFVVFRIPGDGQSPETRRYAIVRTRYNLHKCAINIPEP
jgi:hypothetical protein